MGDKLNKVLIGIMIAILVLIIGFGAALFMYLKPKTVTKEVPVSKEKTEIVSVGDSIISNIRSDNGNQPSGSYVKFSVGISITKDETFKTLLTDRNLEIRSEIEKIVRVKSLKELNDPVTAMSNLEKEIKNRLKKLYNTDKIVEVHVSDYLVQ